MPLRLRMTLAQDGKDTRIDLLKLFQVAFINNVHPRGGQFARIYTGMMFKGRYERGKDAPAILVDMQIETGEGSSCTDLTGSFGMQIVPLQRYWGGRCSLVSDARTLRSYLGMVAPNINNDAVEPFLQAYREVRKPILVVGEADSDPMLAFPADVDLTVVSRPRLRHYERAVQLLPDALTNVAAYCWLQHEVKLDHDVTRLSGLDFYFEMRSTIDSKCPDVSHFFVADRRLRMRRNTCELHDGSDDTPSNTYCAGGVKEIGVQDKTPYFEEWMRQRVRDSAIFEIKDKKWFAAKVAREFNVEVQLDDEVLSRYLVNRVAAAGVLLAALATLGLDHGRISA
jgi:hypothetical protein